MAFYESIFIARQELGEKDLENTAACRKFQHTADDGKAYNTKHYNLEIIRLPCCTLKGCSHNKTMKLTDTMLILVLKAVLPQTLAKISVVDQKTA
mgnify:CR=1 FL=1